MANVADSFVPDQVFMRYVSDNVRPLLTTNQFMCQVYKLDSRTYVAGQKTAADAADREMKEYLRQGRVDGRDHPI